MTDSEVVLAGSPDAALVRRAADRLTDHLLRLCVEVGRRIADEQREVRSQIETARRDGEALEPLERDLAECERVVRRLARIRERPLAHACGQVERLLDLIRSGEFERIAILSDGLVAAVRRGEPPGGGPAGNCCIHLPLPDSSLFPVYIEVERGGQRRRTFMRRAGHPHCWGEAATLIQSALEAARLDDLLLIARVWARRNLAGPASPWS